MSHRARQSILAAGALASVAFTATADVIPLSRFSEFPAKGRATGGVRAHTFLKGEASLALAWVGPAPALALGADGSLRTLPDAGAKRDASGTPMDAVVGSIGRAL